MRKAARGRDDAAGARALEGVDLGLLALFAGQRMNEVVLAKVRAAGYKGIRVSHGYVLQHFLDGDRSSTELGPALGVSQQAASKFMNDLSALGYLEDVRGKDARARRMDLSRRGRSMLAYAKKLRESYHEKILRGVPEATLAHTHATLRLLLEGLGGTEAAVRRLVPDADPAAHRR